MSKKRVHLTTTQEIASLPFLSLVEDSDGEYSIVQGGPNASDSEFPKPAAGLAMSDKFWGSWTVSEVPLKRFWNGTENVAYTGEEELEIGQWESVYEATEVAVLATQGSLRLWSMLRAWWLQNRGKMSQVRRERVGEALSTVFWFCDFFHRYAWSAAFLYDPGDDVWEEDAHLKHRDALLTLSADKNVDKLRPEIHGAVANVYNAYPQQVNEMFHCVLAILNGWEPPAYRRGTPLAEEVGDEDGLDWLDSLLG